MFSGIVKRMFVQGLEPLAPAGMFVARTFVGSNKLQ
jgi:hypothetical protein